MTCLTFYQLLERKSNSFTAQVKGNWDFLFDFMKKQENDLTQEVKVSSSHHKNPIADLAAKVRDNNSLHIFDHH